MASLTMVPAMRSLAPHVDYNQWSSGVSAASDESLRA
jgi:hypothetical protein